MASCLHAFWFHYFLKLSCVNSADSKHHTNLIVKKGRGNIHGIYHGQ